MKNETKKFYAGIDIGSTTVKIVITDPKTEKRLYSDYKRHNADLKGTLHQMLELVDEAFPGARFIPAVCGSGGMEIAKKTGAFFIQEVVANSLVIRRFYKDVRVSIELGGQDAKVVFFTLDKETGQLIASDMRMNGSCAGGTGAFIDQVAELLSIKTEEFSDLADSGSHVYDISGRCGVFAKTDIQPLLNQGVSRGDIALSAFHAIVKQTIGGLAQGMEITPKVIFEGGPLTFNKRLISVFKERLSLTDDQIVEPDRPEILVAEGAALSIDVMFDSSGKGFSAKEFMEKLTAPNISAKDTANSEEAGFDGLFFNSDDEKKAFLKRHRADDILSAAGIGKAPIPGKGRLDVFMGIDAGSTTSKIVLIDKNCRLVDSFYSNNHGEPLKVIKYALMRLYDKYKEIGTELNVLGLGTTGYGEMLSAKAFMADYHIVETVAHAEAAQFFVPDASFILDIGGQDMKAISLKKGIVTGIVLNEACSAGCGSFVETYSKSLGISVDRIAELAFCSKNPSQLGSRCTVFMNSSIITEQKNGKKTEDILAGISRSIIENVFTKVVRVSNFDDLGEKIVVQGGTFKNDAVLRAFEQYIEREVIRAPYPGEMGAFGIALLVKKQMEGLKAIAAIKENSADAELKSSFIGFESLEKLDYKKERSMECQFCSNQCRRTIITFTNGNSHVTGNRCEKGEIIGSDDCPETMEKVKKAGAKLNAVPDMIKLHNSLIVKDFSVKGRNKEIKPVLSPNGEKIKIGIPRTLEFWNSLPFWKTFFKKLGFDVVVSSQSSYDIFEKGLQYVPSDTACFPAKLVHGHVEELAAKGVDRIFFPMLVRLPRENNTAEGNNTCVMLQGYPLVVEKSANLLARTGVKIDTPIFHWHTERFKNKQLAEWMKKEFSISRGDTLSAIKEGNAAQKQFTVAMEEAGHKLLKSLEGTDKFAVFIAGRPYHADLLINHNISRYFTSLGIPVLTLDSFPDIHGQDLSNVRFETTITFHNRMVEAAIAAAAHPNLEIVQIVSFGCGHDAILSDEMLRELKNRSNKEMLILKLDEGEAVGPLNIRIKSFIETIRSRRKKEADTGKELVPIAKSTAPAWDKELIYTRKHRKEKVVIVPNLSVAFSSLFAAIFRDSGINVKPLHVADKRAIALGKKYVHNDICYPAQINIGEVLAFLEKPENKDSGISYALGLAKNCEACRAGQYATLARKALDEAGFPHVPIVTTGTDTKKIHPGFTISLSRRFKILWGLTIIDTYEMMLRRIRPYEVIKGISDIIFNRHLNILNENISKGQRTLIRLMEEAVADFNSIEMSSEKRKPRVGLVGEILVNYHPAANCYIESYLELNGMEVVQPPMHLFFRKGTVIEKEIGRRGMAPNSFFSYIMNDITGNVFDLVYKKVWGLINRDFRFKEPHGDIQGIVERIKPYIDITYSGAEGWKLPGEIIQMYDHGVNSFVIMQPFGCLPNHITGRGMIKTLKQRCPGSQIIALDYDPDTSVGNAENRLQMLIINARELETA